MGVLEVCGMEKENNEEEEFIIDNKALKGNSEFMGALKDAKEDNRVIEATYKTGEDRDVELINAAFEEKLSSICVYDGEECVKLEKNDIVSPRGVRIKYNMQHDVKYTGILYLKRVQVLIVQQVCLHTVPV